jgi:RNA polymerase sigma-70 factor (ECF subfamily)
MSRQYKKFSGHYNAFFEKVYRYIFFRAGRNKQLAEDLTSEIFMKALENFENYDETRPFAVWIYSIAHNHLVDHYKKVKPEIVDIEVAANELKIYDHAAKDLDVKLDMEKVQLILDKLPANQKDIVVLKYVNDLTNPEIAEILDTSEAHVRVLQHRALQALKTRLANVNI